MWIVWLLLFHGRKGDLDLSLIKLVEDVDGALITPFCELQPL